MKDYNEFWEIMKGPPSKHPSVRFRNYLIVRAVRRILHPLKSNSILDVGCGNGDLLRELNGRLCLDGTQVALSGYDISEYQIKKNRLQGLPFDFRVADFNGRVDTTNKFDIVICSEVIEHLKNWESSLENMADMNKPGGYLILTTQSGKRFKSDIALGHLQHFRLDSLINYLIRLKYKIILGEKRGFPFYNLQKSLFSVFFSASTKIAHSEISMATAILFSITYFLFHLSIKSKSLGPQIFILAHKMG